MGFERKSVAVAIVKRLLYITASCVQEYRLIISYDSNECEFNVEVLFSSQLEEMSRQEDIFRREEMIRSLQDQIRSIRQFSETHNETKHSKEGKKGFHERDDRLERSLAPTERLLQNLQRDQRMAVRRMNAEARDLAKNGIHSKSYS